MVSKEQILNWAKQRYGDTPYAKNYELMKIAYFREFGDLPSKVADLEIDDWATVDVLIVNEVDRYPFKVKADSWNRCEEGDEDCREVETVIFEGGDDTGVIRLRFPPWVIEDYGLPKLDRVYRVRGKVKLSRNGKWKYIEVKAFHEVANPLLDKAIEAVKDLFAITNEVDEDTFKDVLASVGVTDEDTINEIKVKLGIIKKQGKLVMANE